jgi:hypothetical protein
MLPTYVVRRIDVICIADSDQKCRQLNNFSTLTSIISALGTAPIHRLNRTWSAVNQRSMATLESMRKLMGSTKNFAEYRDTLHRANPPCIPFFGEQRQLCLCPMANESKVYTSPISRSSRMAYPRSSNEPT